MTSDGMRREMMALLGSLALEKNASPKQFAEIAGQYVGQLPSAEVLLASIVAPALAEAGRLIAMVGEETERAGGETAHLRAECEVLAGTLAYVMSYLYTIDARKDSATLN